MYISYFCTDHADRKAQQTSKNARRASSKFKYVRDGGMGCSIGVFFSNYDRKQPIAQYVLGNFPLHISNVILLVLN